MSKANRQQGKSCKRKHSTIFKPEHAVRNPYSKGETNPNFPELNCASQQRKVKSKLGNVAPKMLKKNSTTSARCSAQLSSCPLRTPLRTQRRMYWSSWFSKPKADEGQQKNQRRLQGLEFRTMKPAHAVSQFDEIHHAPVSPLRQSKSVRPLQSA